LYEKKIVSGFIPKIGADNWDKKYCEAPDKIGEETKERYEKHIRNESTHAIFKDYNYFGYIDSAEEKPTTIIKSGSVKDKEKKLINPNANTSNQNQSKDIKESLGQSNSIVNLKMKVLEKSPSVADARLINLKKLSASSSNSSLTRQYKQHSSNLSISSTGSGTSLSNSNPNSNGNISNLIAKQRSNSTVNLNNK